MKHLLSTTIAAVVLVGCSAKEMFLPKQSSLPNAEPLLQRQITGKELKAIGDLHLAVEKGDLSKVRQCLESGTNIECVRGKASFRVLHRAAEAGNKSMVRFLIQKKSNVNAMAMQGWTPLDLAQKKSNSNGSCLTRPVKQSNSLGATRSIPSSIPETRQTERFGILRTKAKVANPVPATKVDRNLKST